MKDMILHRSLQLMHIALYYLIAAPFLAIINHYLGFWGIVATVPFLWKWLILPSQTELGIFICEKILKLPQEN
jgi:hypothetical protein